MSQLRLQTIKLITRPMILQIKLEEAWTTISPFFGDL